MIRAGSGHSRLLIHGGIHFKKNIWGLVKGQFPFHNKLHHNHVTAELVKSIINFTVMLLQGTSLAELKY